MSDVTEVPLAPEVFWGCVAALVLGLFSWALYKAMPRSEAGTPPFEDVQSKLGLSAVPAGAFVIGALLWLGLLLTLVAGLYAAIWDMLWQSKEFFEAEDGDARFRFLATRLAGTTAVLGVVVAFPVTLNRLKLSREQNETAKEALFNQKISEAAADLHAQRQVTVSTQNGAADQNETSRFNAWEDDVVRRIAAIDRLEGTVRERRDREIAERVARMLSMYVREVSRKIPPEKNPNTNDPEELRLWAGGLPLLRSDIEAAVAALSRIPQIVGLQAGELQIDLRRSNLQRASLGGLDLTCANLMGANMEGASLGYAQLREANLNQTNLLGANLFKTDLRGASLAATDLRAADLSLARLQNTTLNMTRLQGADLTAAKLTGSFLIRVRFSNETELTDTDLSGAGLRFIDKPTVELLKPFWREVFSDSTVQVANVERPPHWEQGSFDPWLDEDFLTRWRDWQRSIGQDPDNPE